MTAPTFLTLGPEETCHDFAVRRYIEFQQVAARIEFVDDFLPALERVRADDDTYLVQCSAHPAVHLVTERYYSEVFVVDTFLYPTRELALVVRRDATERRRFGLVPACAGYVDASQWPEVEHVNSKPLVGKGLLAGRYDAGVTHAIYAERHPDVLRVEQLFGAVDTTWLVYGRRRRFSGEVIGTRCPEYYAREGAG